MCVLLARLVCYDVASSLFGSRFDEDAEVQEMSTFEEVVGPSSSASSLSGGLAARASPKKRSSPKKTGSPKKKPTKKDTRHCKGHGKDLHISSFGNNQTWCSACVSVLSGIYKRSVRQGATTHVARSRLKSFQKSSWF